MNIGALFQKGVELFIIIVIVMALLWVLACALTLIFYTAVAIWARLDEWRMKRRHKK